MLLNATFNTILVISWLENSSIIELEVLILRYFKKSLNISQGLSETVIYRGADNKMDKIYEMGHKEKQCQWSQIDKQ